MTLLTIPSGSLPDSMVHALQHEIPQVEVHEADDLSLACGEFEAAVRLILIEASRAAELAIYAPAIQRSHPGAAIALVLADRRVPIGRFRDLAVSGRISALLPLDLRLDLWLAVVRLLLSGGEYFPVSLLQTEAPPARSFSYGDFMRSPGQSALEGLTEREIEVLDLVSRGRQNKMIAAELNLSEHTVKVHLHNIISKMQVNNRTEAASIYLEQKPLPMDVNGLDDSALLRFKG
ncbi:MAG: response regulator transcription factor [Pararhizobium sp.]